MNLKEDAANTNWIALVLLVLIVGGLAFGIYWWQKQTAVDMTPVELTPTPTVSPTTTITPTATPTETDETAGWKTYTNKEIEYRLKYPKGLKLVPGGMGNSELSNAREILISRGVMPVLQINAEDNPKGISSLERGKKTEGICARDKDCEECVKGSACKVIAQGKEVNINGERAYQFDIKNSFVDENGGWMFIDKNGEDDKRIYRVAYIANNSYIVRFIFLLSDPDFSKIVGTFKFSD